jgi:hypothetical protein
LPLANRTVLLATAIFFAFVALGADNLLFCGHGLLLQNST